MPKLSKLSKLFKSKKPEKSPFTENDLLNFESSVSAIIEHDAARNMLINYAEKKLTGVKNYIYILLKAKEVSSLHGHGDIQKAKYNELLILLKTEPDFSILYDRFIKEKNIYNTIKKIPVPIIEQNAIDVKTKCFVHFDSDKFKTKYQVYKKVFKKYEKRKDDASELDDISL